VRGNFIPWLLRSVRRKLCHQIFENRLHLAGAETPAGLESLDYYLFSFMAGP
jgi:hypothetical protein